MAILTQITNSWLMYTIATEVQVPPWDESMSALRRAAIQLTRKRFPVQIRTQEKSPLGLDRGEGWECYTLLRQWLGMEVLRRVQNGSYLVRRPVVKGVIIGAVFSRLGMPRS